MRFWFLPPLLLLLSAHYFASLDIKASIELQFQILQAFWQALDAGLLQALLSALAVLPTWAFPLLLPFSLLFFSLYSGLKWGTRQSTYLALGLCAASSFLFNVYALLWLALILTLIFKLSLSSGLKLANCLLALSLLLYACLHFQQLQPIVLNTHLQSALLFFGEVRQSIAELQRGLQQSITEHYEALPSAVKQTCRPVYEAVIEGIGAYQLKPEELKLALQQLSLFQRLTALSPLLLATFFFILLEAFRLLFLAFVACASYIR